MKYGEIKYITMEELTELEMLKTHCIHSDEFRELPKERQNEIYRYCKCHVANEYCLLNLKQIRYAVSQIYFGI